MKEKSMSSYIEESAAGRVGSVQTAFIAQIDTNISQAPNNIERQKWQNLKSKFLSDGTALVTALAAFLEEHYKNIGHEIPNTIKFLSKGDAISVSVDLINGNGVINSSDAVSNYLYIQTNPDNSVTLYLPDNASARAMIAGYTGGESIQTAQGEKIIKSVQFYAGYEMALNDTIEGTEMLPANSIIQIKSQLKVA